MLHVSPNKVCGIGIIFNNISTKFKYILPGIKQNKNCQNYHIYHRKCFFMVDPYNSSKQANEESSLKGNCFIAFRALHFFYFIN